MSFRQDLSNPHHPLASNNEPMHIGSPPASPPTNPTQSQFLPGFLMGDSLQKNNTSSVSNNVRFHTTERLQQPKFAQQTNIPRPSNMNKQNAATPPTTSLWSMPVSPAPRNVPSSDVGNGLDRLANIRSPPMKNNFSPRPPRVVDSNTSNHIASTPGQTQNESNYDETWVTVFGYPENKSKYILQQFAQFGTIERYVITNSGNWMHIKYQNKLQVKCALSKNGRVFVDNIMLGVQPCTDFEVMNRVATENSAKSRVTDENSVVGGAFSTPSQVRNGLRPLRQSNTCTGSGDFINHSLDSAGLENAGGIIDGKGEGLPNGISSQQQGIAGSKSFRGVMRHSSMRSLAGSPLVRSNTQDASVNGNGSSGFTMNATNQQGGVLSKALEYMFGWN